MADEASKSTDDAGRRDRLTRQVLDLARKQGFALAGIAPAVPGAHGDALRAWLAVGKHGEMDYLARNVEVRLDPAVLLPGARSILVVADAYADGPRGLGPAGARRGRVAKYAQGDDYHRVIKRRLHQLVDALAAEHPDAVFKTVVDTAPMLEREHATRAGLGWTAKHTLLIHPRHGSYLLLGAVATTLDLASTAEQGHPGPTVEPADHCGTCTRCIDACPTSCITPYSVDATRCISYLTLEHRSPIDPAFFDAMGDWLAGCDVCQDVCPWNNSSNRVSLPVRPEYQPRNVGFDLLEVLSWTEDDRRRAFVRSALKRVKLDMLRRNALIAAGNHLRDHNDPALQDKIAAIAADPEEPAIVRDTAATVLRRLRISPTDPTAER